VESWTRSTDSVLDRVSEVPASIPQQLCLHCGLCCNGVLFKDVELQPGDDPKRLASLGLSLQFTRPKPVVETSVRASSEKQGTVRFVQPCSALCNDNRCELYAERPARCRDFECALFKRVAQSQSELQSALRIVALTRRRAEKVRGLLRQLGDSDEHVALSLRFRKVKRRIEAGKGDANSAEVFGRLSLAMHELNLQLARRFYPG
jgi:uncharacterized protein